MKAAKAAAKKLKNRKSASKEDKVDPSPEKPMDVEADLEDDVSEPVADGEGEDEAAAEEVEAVETEVKKKRRRRVASPKAKGRPRKIEFIESWFFERCRCCKLVHSCC